MDARCRCGEIEIEIAGEPLAQFYCHCDDCQAVHGAAYVPEAGYAAEAVRVVKGEPAQFTLRRSPRFFCATCGTRLFIELPPLKLRGVNGYLLGTAFAPQFHIQCRFAVRPVCDGLPHYRGLPPQFGGSDERAGW